MNSSIQSTGIEDEKLHRNENQYFVAVSSTLLSSPLLSSPAYSLVVLEDGDYGYVLQSTDYSINPIPSLPFRHPTWNFVIRSPSPKGGFVCFHKGRFSSDSERKETMKKKRKEKKRKEKKRDVRAVRCQT
ncbi:uncharacterized protein EAE97_009440 [Botrytis byssoidea]|uniref:Uncharacterized protein n=1 Tax=Botrytis byssoidea TaxID=139641 RepID=A0A9P5I6I3_9HELO|nr:uncharacterized protein EAE97_009440 [Botrytis byssoidea]KAF7929843.1 hypothetical protein EAE97_009440 [Botrytis byssoidea]